MDSVGKSTRLTLGVSHMLAILKCRAALSGNEKKSFHFN